jgi:large subunit ribosomal protein L28
MGGNKVSHSNRKSPRTWNANVHKVKVEQEGTVTNEYVCAKCLKSGKVKRAE